MKKKKFKYDFGFIGLGRMAEVILRAMLSANLTTPNKVLVSHLSARELQKIKKRLKVAITTDNHAIAKQCRYIWIGTKPFQAAKALENIQSSLAPESILISMMAGISLKFLKKQLGNKCCIIRIMPNTPALLGAGMTGVYFPPKTNKKIREMIKKILNGMGEMVEVKREKDLDGITGLSGSGPAFVYALTEGLIEGGKQSGLTPLQSRKLALQTITGAVKMIRETGKSPEDLIKDVVSKGGTTEAGLKILKKNNTIPSLTMAVKEATKRSKEIREEME